MQRWVFPLFFLLTYCVHASQEIEVFHHDDRQGIRNKEGQVLIPPVYDQLGWSTGDFLTINELIGYRENGLWGLINLSNRRISEPIYYHLSPHNDEKILAAIKGRFSNQLFYGILDEKGNVKISCNYFSIEPIADQYLVSKYENGRVVQGTINSEYNVVIPTQYIAIQDLSPTILACQRQDFKWEFADENGRLLHDLRVDGFSRWHEYIQLENRGVFGLMSSDGDLLHPVSFKGFSYEGSQPEPVPFPKWVLLDDNLKETKAVEGDSVKEEGKSFMYFKNGETYYLQDISEGVNLDQVEVLDAQKGFFITKNKNTNRWQARKTSGELILDDRDSIYFDGLYFRGEKDGGWIVHNRFGRRISKRRYEAVGLTMSSMVPVKLNNYWGLMDFQGELQVKHKFEGITTGKEDLFVVRYLNKYGVIDAFGNWEIPPTYDQLRPFGYIWIGKLGAANLTLDNQGNVLYRTENQLTSKTHHVEITGYDGKKGVLSQLGEVIIDPIYDDITWMNDYFVCRDSNICVVRNGSGGFVIKPDDAVTSVESYANQLFRIVKNGRAGFVDQEGRIRIANRYDAAHDFHAGFAGVKLRGKWGFIDQYESLTIQPLYDSVGVFTSNMTIVKKNDKYGLVSLKGKEVVDVAYPKIRRTSGNSFILYSDQGKQGFISPEGEVLLQPNYDLIEDAGSGLIIVGIKGKKGIMDGSGYVKIPIRYDDIRIVGDYIVLKKT